MRRTKYPTMIDPNGFMVLTDSGHDIWMKENNPDNWDTETWRAYTERCSTDARFLERAQKAKRDYMPRPHPFEDGWVQSKNFDPIAGLAKRMGA